MWATELHGIASVTGSFLILSTAAVTLRLLARYRQHSRFGPDDATALAAWLGFVGMSTCMIFGMTHGFVGFPSPNSKAVLNAVHPTMESIYIAFNPLLVWTTGNVKLSALFFYWRLFVPGFKCRDVFSCITMVAIAATVSWTITLFVMSLNLCGHHSIAWEIQPGNSAHCRLNFGFQQAFAISDVILDVLILCLAFPKIWSLSMSNGQKLSLSAVFLVALVGIAASCAHMAIILLLVHRGRVADDIDPFQSNTLSAYFGMLEGGLGLLCVNLPSLWYFVTPQKSKRILEGITSLGSSRSLRAPQSLTVIQKSTTITVMESAHNDGAHTQDYLVPI